MATTPPQGCSGQVNLATGQAANGSTLIPQPPFPATLAALTIAGGLTNTRLR